MDVNLMLLFPVVVWAFFVQTTLGFGAALSLVSLGAFVLPLNVLLPCFVLLSIIQTTYIAVRYRSTIHWALLLRKILPWMGVGLPIGMILFRISDENLLKGAFGITVAALAASALIKMHQTRAAHAADTNHAEQAAPTMAPLNRWTLAFILIGGGLIHGAYSTGGPSVVYVMSRELTDKQEFRSTINALWTILQSILLAGYVASGDFNSDSLPILAIMVLALVVGVVAGEWAFSRLRGDTFRTLVYGLLLVAGIMLSRSLLTFVP